jgi:glycosyltransferase involved in cell wall biosynthesis
MNILILIKRFEIGGAEDHVLELANNLNDRGVKVLLLSKPGRKVSELHPAVKFESFRFKKYLLPINVLLLIKKIRKEKIDLIHAHQDTPILVASVVRWITGIPVVATIHGLLKKEIGNEFIQKHLAKVIVVSKNSFIGSQRLRIVKSKAELINNSLPKIRSNNKSFDKNRIVYASRVDRGHYSFLKLLLIQSLSLLDNYNRNISIQIAGDGNSFNLLKCTAQKLNSKFGRKIIEPLGYKKNVNEIFSHAALVIGVGRVAMQALALGTPVISVNRKHSCKIICLDNYKYMRDNNFVSIDDPPPTKEQIVKTIIQLLDNYDFYREQSFQLAEMVKIDFNPDTITSQTIAVYNNCLSPYIVPEPIAFVK